MKAGLTERVIAAIATTLIFAFASVAIADEVDDQVRNQFLLTTEDLCFEAGNAEPEIFRFTYVDADAAGPSKQTARLYRFLCFSGAYNAVHVFFAYSELRGLRRLYFSIPDFEAECDQLAPDQIDCLAATVTATGMTAAGELTNTEFDSVSLTLTSLSCWRGLCDASENGLWVFEGGRFVLKAYEVDATYDGEMTPVRIVSFDGPE